MSRAIPRGPRPLSGETPAEPRSKSRVAAMPPSPDPTAEHSAFCVTAKRSTFSNSQYSPCRPIQDWLETGPRPRRALQDTHKPRSISEALNPCNQKPHTSITAKLPAKWKHKRALFSPRPVSRGLRCALRKRCLQFTGLRRTQLLHHGAPPLNSASGTGTRGCWPGPR
jgi:hypothetical protein